MNNLAKLSLASALLLTAAAGVVSAQQANETPLPPVSVQDDDGARDAGAGRHHGKHGDHKGRHGGKGMRIIDANNDGVIGEDEAAALADSAFMHMDQDRDGKVTEAEFVDGPRSRHSGWFSWNSDEAAAVQKVRTDKFATLDTNKDMSLDKTEFFADARARLAAADNDKDGKVTPWEFRASR